MPLRWPHFSWHWFEFPIFVLYVNTYIQKYINNLEETDWAVFCTEDVQSGHFCHIGDSWPSSTDKILWLICGLVTYFHRKK